MSSGGIASFMAITNATKVVQGSWWPPQAGNRWVHTKMDGRSLLVQVNWLRGVEGGEAGLNGGGMDRTGW